MTVFGEISGSFGDMTPEQRTNLAELVALRSEYYAQVVKISDKLINVLQHPTPEGEADLRELSSALVAPVRSRFADKQRDVIVGDCIDLNELKGMLPMLLMALTQSINLPILMTVLNLEPDMIEQLVGLATDYFKSGM